LSTDAARARAAFWEHKVKRRPADPYFWPPKRYRDPYGAPPQPRHPIDRYFYNMKPWKARISLWLFGFTLLFAAIAIKGCIALRL
jgi:hypothetical protein